MTAEAAGIRHRWMRAARVAGTSFFLTMAQLAAPRDERIGVPIAIVREVSSGEPVPFDPREVVGRGIVLTVPYEGGGGLDRTGGAAIWAN